jgi:hypothetical protein
MKTLSAANGSAFVFMNPGSGRWTTLFGRKHVEHVCDYSEEDIELTVFLATNVQMFIGTVENRLVHCLSCICGP